jgi:protease IV
MSLDADLIVDRRRMRRKLTFWRVLAVVVIVLAVVGLAGTLAKRTGFAGAGAYIARVTIQGLIRDDQERVRQLDRLAQSSTAHAVVVHLDSPGGTTAGSEQLYDSLKRLKEKKPLVIVVDGLAASGGYIAALAGDHIVAKQTSLVGSIGVLFQYPNVADLLTKLGVKVESIKSSPLKAAPNGFEPTSPEARAAIESIIKDSYDWFKGLVRDRRHLNEDELQTVADGRVFTGHQGLGLKLVDELGDEQTGIAWLASEKKVDAKLPVRDYRLHDRFSDLPFLHAAAAAALVAAGFPTLARGLGAWGAIQAVERLNLDGLLALWHPASAN